MAQGFTAEGTVRLTFPKKRPTGSRVQFAVRAGTIPCSSGGNPPTVSITAPVANSVFTAPATIAVTADAQDSDGAITQVAFFANGNPIGAATASPFTIQWLNVPVGEYSLTVVASDIHGSQTTSAAVLITVGPSQALYFIHADHLNTPRLIADATQKTVWKWEQHEPFGASPANRDPDNDSIAFTYPQRFPGQYYDAETLLHYNYFRDYDSGIGRYVKSDPIGLDGGLNTYAYANAGPVTYFDENGLCRVRGTWIKEPGWNITTPRYVGVSPVDLELTRIGTVSFFRAGVRIGVAAEWGIRCEQFSDDYCPVIMVNDHYSTIPFWTVARLPVGINLPIALLGARAGGPLVAALAIEPIIEVGLNYAQTIQMGRAAVAKVKSEGPQRICEALHGCRGYP